MIIDFRKLITTSSLPALILCVSFVYSSQFILRLPHDLKSFFPYFPYIIFIIGIVLSWIFHHCREFNLLLLQLVLFIAVQQYHWTTNAAVDQQYAFLLLTLLIPVNYAINAFSRERGILNHYGIRRFVYLGIQLFLIAWLLENPVKSIKYALTYKIFENDIFNVTLISQPILLTIIFLAFIFLIKTIKNPTYLNSGTITSLIIITTAMHYIAHPAISIFYFSIAGILIIVSITLNAYSLAYIDELTNLPSRRALKQNMDSLGKRYAIAMIDIDFFKKFNDKYGHDIGDQVLRMLSSHLRNVRGGKAFRYGGEEFTIVFQGKTIDEARLTCENLCKKIAATPFILRGKKRPKNITASNTEVKKSAQQKELKITISIGLAERNDVTSIATEVMKQADNALYKAKKAGRNRVAISD